MPASPYALTRRSSLYVVLAFYLLACAAMTFYSMRATQGAYIYPLDDTYITTAMANNLSQHGVWGVTRHEFSSSSSTPLFVLLLSAAYWLTGPQLWWPLLLATGFGALAIVTANWLLREHLSGTGLFLGLLCLAVLTPLHVVALTGMEHTLHIVLAIGFLALSARAIANPRTLDYRLPFLASVMVATRYEGLFLAGIVAAALLLRHCWKFAAYVFVAAFIPVAAYAAVSLSQGWEWLPNSVLIKGAAIDFRTLAGLLDLLGWRAVSLISTAPPLAALTLTVLIAYVVTHKSGLWEQRRVGLLLSLLAIFAHLQFARLGWVYRYEAYLIAMAVVSLAAASGLIVRLSLRKLGLVVFVALVAWAGLTIRAARATYRIPISSWNVFEQQWQMARFLKQYYYGASIAANDIGAITYLADPQCLDLVGLANRTVFKHRRSETYTAAVIDSQTERMGTRIAVVYEYVIRQRRPESWVRVGRWRIHDNLFLAGNTVSFYAVHPGEREDLAENLRRYSSQLPSSVEVLKD